LLSPFGNHWVAGGALAGVVVLSVVLILDVPRQAEHYVPEEDAVAPSSETLSEVRKETVQRRVLPSELPAESEAKRNAPVAPKPRFDFYGALPEREVVAPQAEPRARLQQAPAVAAEETAGTTPAPTADEPAGITTAPAVAAEKPASSKPAPAAAVKEFTGTTTAPAGDWYLQVGSFREKNRANEFKARLTGLGYRCEVHEVRVTDMDIYHRVRVGPFAGNDALEKSKQQLGAAGFEAYAVRVEE
jgi:cell division septation protein DedD